MNDAKPDAPILFFDLDGTISDSRPGIVRSYLHALKTLGRHPLPTDESLQAFIGPPLRSAFPILLDSADIDLVEQAVTIFRERYGTIGLFENQLYPEIPPLLEALTNRKFELYIVTAKPREYAVRIIDHFGITSFFQDIYGPELNGTHDSKTELIAHILTSRSIEASRVKMIGDRKEDIHAGLSNGCRTIGVLYGYGTAEELTRAGAHQLIESPLQLLDILGTLVKG